MNRKLTLLLIFLFACFLGMPLYAQAQAQPAASPSIQVNIPVGDGSTGLATPIKVMLLVTALTFAPALLISATSFTRIIVVFSFLRQAMGLQNAPPNQVVIGLSLFITFAVMGPVFGSMLNNGITPFLDGKVDEKVAVTETLRPLREFMYRQTRENDLKLMLEIGRVETPETFEDLPTSALIPAFVLSELKTAFQIGFMLYIPFVVIDMVISMILLAMGMMVLPPVLISLPFKVMLFVLIDGWDLVISSLVQSFR